MVRIRREPDGREIEVPASGTLLDAALDHGMPLPFGCQSSKCGLCAVEVLAGTENGLLPPSPLEAGTLEAMGLGPGIRLACQGRLAGDLVLQPLHAELAGEDGGPETEDGS